MPLECERVCMGDLLLFLLDFGLDVSGAATPLSTGTD